MALLTFRLHRLSNTTRCLDIPLTPLPGRTIPKLFQILYCELISVNLYEDCFPERHVVQVHRLLHESWKTEYSKKREAVIKGFASAFQAYLKQMSTVAYTTPSAFRQMRSADRKRYSHRLNVSTVFQMQLLPVANDAQRDEIPPPIPRCRWISIHKVLHDQPKHPHNLRRIQSHEQLQSAYTSHSTSKTPVPFRREFRRPERRPQ